MNMEFGKFSDAVNGMAFTNEKGQVEIFDRKDFLTEIFAILTHYLRFSPEYADNAIRSHNVVFSETDLNYYSVLLLCHETPYHWAMEIAYGDLYWTRGYNSNLPDDYDKWISQYFGKAENTKIKIKPRLP